MGAYDEVEQLPVEDRALVRVALARHTAVSEPRLARLTMRAAEEAGQKFRRIYVRWVLPQSVIAGLLAAWLVQGADAVEGPTWVTLALVAPLAVTWVLYQATVVLPIERTRQANLALLEHADGGAPD